MSAQPVPVLEKRRGPGSQPRPQLAVAPPPPVAVPRAPFVGLVLLVVVSGVLGILLLNTKINENAFHLYELRQEQAALDQRQDELEQRLAELDSTAQLSAAARRLGMVQVPVSELGRLRMPAGEVEGAPAPVAPAPEAPAGDGADPADPAVEED